MRKAIKPLPPIDVLRSLLRYEPETGKLYWLPRPPEMFPRGLWDARVWNKRYAGTEAFTFKMVCGHYAGCILRERYLAHRVAWYLYYGKEAGAQIDHKNRQPGDNRIENLREATHGQNIANREPFGISGYKGVHQRGSRWYAQIGIGGKARKLGTFDNPEDAAKAFDAAAKLVHGEYACLNNAAGG